MSADENSDVQNCVDILDRYITELRSYMKRFPWFTVGNTASAAVQEKVHSDEWEHLSTEVTFRCIMFLFF